MKEVVEVVKEVVKEVVVVREVPSAAPSSAAPVAAAPVASAGENLAWVQAYQESQRQTSRPMRLPAEDHGRLA
ncbi:MAG: hypothetical protein IPN17_23375 [Deltaproteobacteria bacterium]|nr:hypothetical protein [Deltaproteobacteria bacterium]